MPAAEASSWKARSEDFAITVNGKICLDIGSSTGGFTDCLLQDGARHVYAVDVTPQQMAWRLVQDPRVTQIKANARNLLPEQIAEPAGLVTMDVSFISAAKVLPAPVVAAAGPHAEYLILVKPQFELDRGDIGRGRIVRDAALHQRAVERVRVAAAAAGLRVEGIRPSRFNRRRRKSGDCFFTPKCFCSNASCSQHFQGQTDPVHPGHQTAATIVKFMEMEPRDRC